MKIAKPIFILLCLFWITSCNGNDSSSQQKVESRVLDSIDTVAGSMELVREGTGYNRDHKIQIAGKTVGSFPNLLTVNIASSYPKPPNTKLVLLALNGGGTACPIMLRVVKVSKNSKALVSDEFGTCSETVHTKYSNGFWIISVGGYNFNSKSTWKYNINSGQLKEQTK